MIDFTQLDLGFADAINYKRRENKNLFNKFFVKSEELDELLRPSTYFLIGDKGTGKTAYSVYLSNNEYKDTVSFLNLISETEYTKFIKLKNEKHLTLSDYSSIWRVLILLLMSKQIEKGEDLWSKMRNYIDFQHLRNGIETFYSDAFAPEILNAMHFVEEAGAAVKALANVFETGVNARAEISYDKQTFQLNLLYLEECFKKSLKKLKLAKSHILFIDGIDIRPRNIHYEDYLECVKGLANAIWMLNNEYFAQIKDSKGRMRVVLLVRPDIFAQLGLQNLNNKVRDNSVLLDWQTTYPLYRQSKLFKLVDRMLSVQQDGNLELGQSWDYYFPFTNLSKNGEKDSSFVSFLRFSMSKPRDILSFLKILQEKMKKDNSQGEVVTDELFNDSQIRADYSRYLLGEVKNYLEFYHTEADYELFLRFFNYLRGKASFSYDEYFEAYCEFADYIEKNRLEVPVQFASSDEFLQFLYDLNVIYYVTDNEDGSNHIHWSYREKNYSNINPKVMEGVRYNIHYGLQKALDTGKKYYKRRSIENKRI